MRFGSIGPTININKWDEYFNTIEETIAKTLLVPDLDLSD
jgi:hypothetical protein